MDRRRRCHSPSATGSACRAFGASASGATYRPPSSGPSESPHPHDIRGVTTFRFDEKLRRKIVERLGRFEVRRRPDAGSLKHAAVAIVVVEADTPGEAAFLLTKRTPRLRAHGGQWALPGGRVDPARRSSRRHCESFMKNWACSPRPTTSWAR